jgi:hypothetical protein
MRARFQQCYTRALARDGDVPQNLVFDVELLVKDDGSVGAVKIEGEQTSELWELFSCVKGRVQGSRFDPPPTVASRLRFSVTASNIVPGGLAGLK